MLVKDLITKLQAMPQDAEVIIETLEDPNPVKNIQLITDEDDERYSKGDVPSSWGTKFPYVTITD